MSSYDFLGQVITVISCNTLFDITVFVDRYFLLFVGRCFSTFIEWLTVLIISLECFRYYRVFLSISNDLFLRLFFAVGESRLTSLSLSILSLISNLSTSISFLSVFRGFVLSTWLSHPALALLLLIGKFVIKWLITIAGRCWNRYVCNHLGKNYINSIFFNINCLEIGLVNWIPNDVRFWSPIVIFILKYFLRLIFSSLNNLLRFLWNTLSLLFDLIKNALNNQAKFKLFLVLAIKISSTVLNVLN